MWTLLLVGWMLLPGCWALTGPEEIRGYVGGSLSVRCDYGKSYTDYTKFWCKKRYFVGLCSDYLYIEIPSSRLMKTKGRVSIADDRRQLFFTASIVNLTEEDSGPYQCGLRVTGWSGWHEVKVTVFPGEFLICFLAP
uniref:Immunoglobulin domain-containing protein n=1 Tax=Sphenodon punctatus TaxID=8508 RepID=A0A8D0H018_SPHPU